MCPSAAPPSCPHEHRTMYLCPMLCDCCMQPPRVVCCSLEHTGGCCHILWCGPVCHLLSATLADNKVVFCSFSMPSVLRWIAQRSPSCQSRFKSAGFPSPAHLAVVTLQLPLEIKLKKTHYPGCSMPPGCRCSLWPSDWGLPSWTHPGEMAVRCGRGSERLPV